MDVGMQFFPAVSDDERPPAQYWDEALRLVELADALGYHHVRSIEHHFDPYGGYSPNPMVFLAAAAQRSVRLRLIAGTLLPVFNHPLHQAGEIGMLDAICGGRLEVGFGRAFLLHEFVRFGIPMSQGLARFDENLDAITRLLEQDEVAFDGAFHQWPSTTSLPRPTQRPRPPFWVAASYSEESFRKAGADGYGVMTNPNSSELGRMLEVYREAYREAGHDGEPRVMIGLHMLCHESSQRARTILEEGLAHHHRSLVGGATGWDSSGHPGYDPMIGRMIETLQGGSTLDEQIASGVAWVGSPDEIVEQAQALSDEVGGFEVASLQVNSGSVTYDDAARSVELFAADVLPKLRGDEEAAR